MRDGLLPCTHPASTDPMRDSQESHTAFAADCLAAHSPAGVLPDAAGVFSSETAARVLPVGAAETADPAPSSRSGGVRTLYLPWPPKQLSPNARGNRRVRAIFTRQYRKQVAEAAWAAGFTPMCEPALRLVRVLLRPPSARWDFDNAIACFKAGQDGIADALGANDRTFRPVWDMGPPVKGGDVICEFDPIPA